MKDLTCEFDCYSIVNFRSSFVENDCNYKCTIIWNFLCEASIMESMRAYGEQNKDVEENNNVYCLGEGNKSNCGYK